MAPGKVGEEAGLPATTPLKLGTPVLFAPSEGSPEAAIIWLHGFGDGPKGWTQALGPIRRAAPNGWKWLHLRAPPVAQPCYQNRKLPGWGRFLSQDCLHVGSVDYEAVDAGYEAAVAAVHAEVEALESGGLAPGRIVIGGFSQGAAVALQSACSYPRRLAGCVVLSGWLSQGARSTISTSSIKDFPLILCHGTKDDMVGFDCGEAGAKLLQEAGAALQFERLEGVAHASSAQEMRAAAAFLQKVLPAVNGGPALKTPQWEEEDSSDGESDEEDGVADVQISYLCKRLFDKVRGQLETGAEISEADLKGLDAIEDMADDEVLVALDISKLGGHANFEHMLRELGAKGAAQAFVKAVDAVGKDLPEDERAPEMTVKEWRQAEESSEIDSEGLSLDEEGEEEELREEDEEVDAEASEGEPAPVSKQDSAKASKKRKTG